MVEYFRSRNEATNIFDEEDKRIYNVITCAADFINLDNGKTRTFLDNREFIKYAENHGEMNMIQLFKHFKFPIPETEEQKKDPRFCLHLLYKKDSNEKLIPRENIYYCEKNIKGYKNPLKSTYTLLDNGTKIDNKNIIPLNKNTNLDEMKKSKKIDKEIHNLRNTIYNKNELSDNSNNIKLLKYDLCIKHYSKQIKLLGFKDLNEIDLEKLSSLGQIYYIIKKAIEQKEALINPFNNCEINKNPFVADKDENFKYNYTRNFFNPGIINIKNKKKEEQKISFIDKLLENSKIADNNFGYLSLKSGESQIIFKNFADIKIDSNKKNINNNRDSQNFVDKFEKLRIASQNKNEQISINNNNIFMDNNFPRKNSNESQYEGSFGINTILYDDYRLVLLLKGKRVDYSDLKGNKNINKYYFRFYVEQKLLNIVEVIFNKNVAKEGIDKFKNIMNTIKINEEVFMAFAYNPTLYFNVRCMNYDFPQSGVEYVFYIDSSKENPNIEKIFEGINK